MGKQFLLRYDSAVYFDKWKWTAANINYRQVA